MRFIGIILILIGAAAFAPFGAVERCEHAARRRRSGSGRDRADDPGTYDSTKSSKPYVLEFFAVWCPHCQREVAQLDKLQAADGDKVDVIAVPASPLGFDKTSMLQPGEIFMAFAQRYNVTFRIGFDGLFLLPYDYGVAGFPTIFVVSGDRKVAAVEVRGRSVHETTSGRGCVVPSALDAPAERAGSRSWREAS